MKSPSALMFVAGVALVLWAFFAPKDDGTNWIGKLVPSFQPAEKPEEGTNP